MENNEKKIGLVEKAKEKSINIINKIKHFDIKTINSDFIVDTIRKPKIYIPLIIVIVGYNGVKYGINHWLIPYEKSHYAMEVNSLKVQGQDVPLATELVGQTRSPQAIEIYTRVSGFLDKQIYREGSWVKAGDVLFEMDKRPFVAQLEASQAELASSEAALKTATLTLDRVKPLAKANALSQQSLDDAKGEFLRAKANVDRAKANVETAKLNLEYCTIKSPIDGLASVREVALGTYIQVGSPTSRLTQVNQMNPMWVYFSVSEDQMLKFNKMIKNQKIQETSLSDLDVEIQMVDGSVYPYLGKIGFTDILYNVNTGTRLMRAVFPNPDVQLQQGQFVTARLKGIIQPNAILVPQEAVQESQKGPYVWVIGKDNRVQSRNVTVGAWSGKNWIIEGGLEDGENVVVSNTLRMSPEQLVKPKPVELPKPSPVAPKLPEPTKDNNIENPLKPGNELEGVKLPKAESPLIEKMPEVKVLSPNEIKPENSTEVYVPTKITPVPSSLEVKGEENK